MSIQPEDTEYSLLGIVLNSRIIKLVADLLPQSKQMTMPLKCLIPALLFFTVFFFIQPFNADAADLSDTEVTIVWTGETNIVLEVAGERYPMRAGQERQITLPVADAIIVSVITPAATYVADEFLIIEDDSEQTVYISMVNGQVAFEIGSEPVTATRTAAAAEETETRPAVQREEPVRSTVQEPSDYAYEQYSFGLNLEELDDGGILLIEFYNRNLLPRQGANHGIVWSTRLSYLFLGGLYSSSSPMTEVPTLHVWNLDIGAGYGWNLGKFTPSATLNLVAASFLFVRYELDDNQDRNDSDSEFFPSPSDTAFIRLHAAFQPSEQRRFYLTGSLDLVGVFGDNSDTTLYAGIGFSL